jgi:hypothetical protein
LGNYNISYPGNSKVGTTVFVLGNEYLSVGSDNRIIATVVRRNS